MVRVAKNEQLSDTFTLAARFYLILLGIIIMVGAYAAAHTLGSNSISFRIVFLAVIAAIAAIAVVCGRMVASSYSMFGRFPIVCAIRSRTLSQHRLSAARAATPPSTAGSLRAFVA